MSVPSMGGLTAKKCKPCEGDIRPFSTEQAAEYVRQLRGWSLSTDGKSISREYVMRDFIAACGFISRIAPVAEAEDHHPDLHLTGYRKLRIELATHAIGGLSENDFILAAKIDQIPKTLKQAS